MSIKKSESQNLLLFQLNGSQLFALNVLKVKEIITDTSFNQLPESHSSLAGVTQLRGVTLPVIDLGAAMGLTRIDIDAKPFPSIIVTECNGKTQGFLVRKVENIIAINWHDIKIIPRASGKNHYATGVIQLNNKLVTLVDVEKVMHETVDDKDDIQADLLTQTQLNVIKGKKVLIVDDSLIARKKIASVIEILGLEYQLASNADEALQLLTDFSSPFDTIISDIEMPQVNGYEFSRKVRDLAGFHDTTYLILHTSLTVNKHSKDFEDSKANALITKFNPKVLAENIFVGITSP